MNALLNQCQSQEHGGTGCLVCMDGSASHTLIQHTLRVLESVVQGHCSASTHENIQEERGDNDKPREDSRHIGHGAGILLGMPRAFFESVWPFLQEKPHLQWGIGQCFMPNAPSLRAKILDIIAKNLYSCGLRMLATRHVPMNAHVLSTQARKSMPILMQILVCESEDDAGASRTRVAFEHALYVARRSTEKAVYEFLQYHRHDVRQFYILSMSARTIVYKGLLDGARLGALYPDLQDTTMASHFAIYHQRFYASGTTSWRAVQPLRSLAATGRLPATETLRQRWRLYAPLLMPELTHKEKDVDLQRILPVIDSLSGPPLVPAATGAALDNICEFLLHKGYSLPSALHCLFPSRHHQPTPEQRFLAGASHAVNVVSTDGDTWLALTHHGAHTCQYTLTGEDILIVAPAAGFTAIDTARVKEQGRIAPDSTLFIDLKKHRMLVDKGELSGTDVPLSHECEGGDVLGATKDDARHASTAEQDATLHADTRHSPSAEHNAAELYLHFGFTDKVAARMRDMSFFAEPLAIFAHNPCFFSYFRAIASQFHLPDRCDIALGCHVRVRQNTLLENGQLPYILVESVVISPSALHKLLDAVRDHARLAQEHTPVRLDAFFTLPDSTGLAQTGVAQTGQAQAGQAQAGQAQTGQAQAELLQDERGQRLQKALSALRAHAEDAVKAGASVLVLSHAACLESMSAHTVPIPSVLALASVHSHLLRKDIRHLCSIIAEVGDAYSPMHMVQLVHAGADVICPFMALSFVRDAGVDTYMDSLTKGMCRIVQSLGVKTITAVQSGVFFEALGIDTPILQEHFTGMHPRLAGVHFGHIAHAAHMRWSRLSRLSRLSPQSSQSHNAQENDDPESHAQKERHHITERVRLLKRALQKKGLRPFKDYISHCHHGTQKYPQGLHHMLTLTTSAPMASSQESIDDILKRFVGMGTPHLNVVALRCLEHIHKSVGAQWCPLPDAHGYASTVAQLDSMRRGNATVALVDAEEVHISLLHKAERGDAHHDMTTLHDAASLIHALRRLQPHVRICVMVPSSAGVGTLAAVLVKAGAHALWLCGAQHGSQGVLQEEYDHMLPWELALAEVQHVLSVHRLRRRVRVRLLAPLFTGRDAVKALLLGAEELSTLAPLLVSLGCHMCEQCHGECPGGLRAGAEYGNFFGDVAHGTRFLRYLAEDIRHNVEQLGYEYIDQIIGRADIMEKCCAHEHKGSVLDISALLQGSSCLLGLRNGTPSSAPFPLTGLEQALLERLTPQYCYEADACHFSGTVRSSDMSVGTHLSGEILRRSTEEAHRTPSVGTYTAKLWGSAGQCLGAFLTEGVTVYVYGEANDHVAKGLCGGVVVVTPASAAPIIKDVRGDGVYDDIVPALIGNAALYGALSGELYVAGSAGDYFAVCNHGAHAVVEGVGDNACLHMHGGRVLILGQCGKNFAKHIHGGTVYVYRPKDVSPEGSFGGGAYAPHFTFIHEADRQVIARLLEQHIAHTQSPRAARILRQWESIMDDFAKIS